MSVRVDLAETAIERVPRSSRCDKRKRTCRPGLAIERVAWCSRRDKSARTCRPGLDRL